VLYSAVNGPVYTNRRHYLSPNFIHIFSLSKFACHCTILCIVNYSVASKIKYDCSDETVRLTAKPSLICAHKKPKILTFTGHEGSNGSQRYSLDLSLTSELDGGGWSTPRPGSFTSGTRTGRHFTGDWLGRRAGLNRCKLRPYRDYNQGHSSP
jgi:hypothetical protein